MSRIEKTIVVEAPVQDVYAQRASDEADQRGRPNVCSAVLAGLTHGIRGHPGALTVATGRVAPRRGKAVLVGVRWPGRHARYPNVAALDATGDGLARQLGFVADEPAGVGRAPGTAGRQQRVVVGILG